MSIFRMWFTWTILGTHRWMISVCSGSAGSPLWWQREFWLVLPFSIITSSSNNHSFSVLDTVVLHPRWYFLRLTSQLIQPSSILGTYCCALNAQEDSCYFLIWYSHFSAFPTHNSFSSGIIACLVWLNPVSSFKPLEFQCGIALETATRELMCRNCWRKVENVSCVVEIVTSIKNMGSN